MKETLEKAKQALLSRRSMLARTVRQLNVRDEPNRVEGERREESGEEDRDVLVEHEQVELAEIDSALARIADGSFGVCESCGGSIGRARLRAIPEARKCLQCASSASGARA